MKIILTFMILLLSSCEKKQEQVQFGGTRSGESATGIQYVLHYTGKSAVETQSILVIFPYDDKTKNSYSREMDFESSTFSFVKKAGNSLPDLPTLKFKIGEKYFIDYQGKATEVTQKFSIKEVEVFFKVYEAEEKIRSLKDFEELIKRKQNQKAD